jgi:hypothetical protein
VLQTQKDFPSKGKRRLLIHGNCASMRKKYHKYFHFTFDQVHEYYNFTEMGGKERTKEKGGRKNMNNT